MSRQRFGGTPQPRQPSRNQDEPLQHPLRPAGPQRTRSGSPSVLKSIGLANPVLKIHLLEETLFLHPAHDGPTEDPSVSGSVVLYLPKAKNLKSLSVRLIGRQDIAWPDGRPYESTIVLDKNVTLFETDTHLEKGEHTFSFDIIVPSKSATYERCTHGRVRHTVTAKAKGLGNLGQDVLSEEKMLFLIVNPGGAGASEPPPPLQENLEGNIEDLGPYAISLTAQHIMVGGLLLLRLNIVSPPSDLIIYNSKIKVNQHYLLTSALDPTHTFSPPSDSRLVAVLDSVHPPNYGRTDIPSRNESSSNLRSGSQAPSNLPMKYLAAGEECKITHLARLPNDNVVRPSTLIGTETGIHISHSIAVELTYKVGNRETEAFALEEDKKRKGKGEAVKDRRKLVVTRPLEIFSCCSFLDSLTLPPYSINDPHPGRDESAPLCVCSMKISDVIKVHGSNLLKEEVNGVTFAQLYKDDSAPTSPMSPTSPTSPYGYPGETRGRQPNGYFASLGSGSDTSSMSGSAGR